MANTTPTTRLQAVNSMLQAIGEAPVTSLSSATGVDTPTAISTLDATLRSFLARGWEYNTEEDYPLPADEYGEVATPINALSVNFNKRRYTDIYPVVRGTRVYDRKNHTYNLGRTLKATVIIGLNFEELPETARTYIHRAAARQLIVDTIGETDLYQFSQAGVREAWTAVFAEETDNQELNMLSDTPDFYRLGGHR